jgi:ComF family protein
MTERSEYIDNDTLLEISASDTDPTDPLGRICERPTIFQQFVRLLLPPVCRLCGEPLLQHASLFDICPACVTSCIRYPEAACPICAEPFQASIIAPHPCTLCANHPPAFTWLRTIGIHQDSLLHGIHQLKYAGAFHLARPLTQMLLWRAYREICAYSPQALVPVPLHPSRLRQRGYNQALLIARHLGTALEAPVLPRYLVRIRATQSQTDLTRAQRQQNLRGAFALHGDLPPQRLLLVDDVVTTTSTARECASILTSAGHEVAVIALSRARAQS